MLNWLDKFHKTQTGYVVFALVELALAYLCISLALNQGDWPFYVLTLVFLIGFLQNLTKLLKGMRHGRR